MKHFIAIAPLTSQLVAGGSAGITTVGELIAAAKAKPGQLKFGSAGIGTGSHFGVEKFNLAVGIKAVHVPAGPRGNLRNTATFGQPTRRFDQIFGSGGPRAFQLAARVSF